MTTYHSSAASPPARRSAAASTIYRRLWRWHFYAGVLCLPLLLSLAVTGALYVFHREIDDVMYRDQLLRQQAIAGPLASTERLIVAALAHTPGQALAVTWPNDTRHTVQVDVLQAGGARQVFVDPVSGKVQGSLVTDERLMTLVKRIHSLAVAGPIGQGLIEVTAGWLLVLGASGIYMWWPRGQRGVFGIRDAARGRVWWRDLHALTGAYAGIVLIFLALTGMPWSVFWGQHVNAWMTEHGLGVPEGVWRNLPESTVPVAAVGDVPWTLEQQSLPRSLELPGAAPISANAASELLAARQMIEGVRLTLPLSREGVYTGMRAHGTASRQRVVHIDQYTGRVLMDVRAAQYGAIGRITDWVLLSTRAMSMVPSTSG